MYPTLLSSLISLAFSNSQIILNQGRPTACTVTPDTATLATTDAATGNIIATGTMAGACTGSGGGGSNPPVFSLNPNPANLTVTGTLTSAGGIVNPNFIAYFATTCTGHVTQTAGCTAVSGAWGSGGAVCNGQANPAGQIYCSPNAANVTVPPNASTSADCTYTFQAINCTNGTDVANSVPVNVVVPSSTGAGCIQGDTNSELGRLGYNRQCSGSIHSLNVTLHPTWNNTYTGFMSGAWTGNKAQFGQGLTAVVPAQGYGSFKFNTGSTPGGVTLTSNPSYGMQGLVSVSTSPGDYFAGSTTVCSAPGSSVNISSKSPTNAQCKLQLNTDYYLNISMADYFPPHTTDCPTSTCTLGWTIYSYGN